MSLAHHYSRLKTLTPPYLRLSRRLSVPDRPPRVVPGLREAAVAALTLALQLLLVQLVLLVAGATVGGVPVGLAAVAGD